MQWLEREGGHIIIGVLLICISIWMWTLGMSKYNDVIMFSLGVLSRSMIGRKDGMPPVQ